MERVYPKEAKEILPPAIVSVPGKIILSGEHSVVYGQPELLAAVGLRCKAEVGVTDSQTIEISSNGDVASHTLGEVLARTQKARTAWEEFSRTKDFGPLREQLLEPLGLAVLAVGEALGYLGGEDIKDSGVRIDIHCEIPPGSGMGSSAAVATAVIAGVFGAFGKVIHLGELNELVYSVEKKQHGFPSGGDNTTVIQGGFIRFEKKVEGPSFEKVTCGGELPSFVLIHTGKPLESTGEMVAWVRREVEKEPERLQALFEEMGAVTRSLIRAFQKGDFSLLPRLVAYNELLLERLGVVGQKAQGLAKEIEKLGGVAKICGAGGVKEGSGIMLCYHDEPEILLGFFKAREIQTLGNIQFGVNGLLIL